MIEKMEPFHIEAFSHSYESKIDKKNKIKIQQNTNNYRQNRLLA